MGELLVTLIVPPIVGVFVFIVIRHIWERDENASGDGVYALNQSDGTVVWRWYSGRCAAEGPEQRRGEL